MRRERAFTLVELMIVVAIIAVLAAVAIPKFAEMIRKSQEGSTKGNLGALRAALAVYYGDNEGQYPGDPKALNSTVLSDALVPKYISAIPLCRLPPYHADTTNVGNHENGPAAGYPHQHEGLYGCWFYDGVNTGSFFGFTVPDANWGLVYVDCTHTDTRGTVWTSY